MRFCFAYSNTEHRPRNCTLINVKPGTALWVIKIWAYIFQPHRRVDCFRCTVRMTPLNGWPHFLLSDTSVYTCMPSYRNGHRIFIANVLTQSRRREMCIRTKHNSSASHMAPCALLSLLTPHCVYIYGILYCVSWWWRHPSLGAFPPTGNSSNSPTHTLSGVMCATAWHLHSPDPHPSYYTEFVCL